MPRELTLHWFPLLPAGVVALLACLLLLLLVQGCAVLFRKQIPLRWIVALGMLRVVAIALFVLVLSEPAVSYLHRVTRPAELLVLVDTSQSMNQAESPEQPSRLDTALTELRQSGLLTALDEQFQPHWFGFDRQAYPIELSSPTKLDAHGASTDYVHSLATAIDLLSAGETPSAEARRVERVLLISDGRDQGSDDLADVALRLGITIDTYAPTGTHHPSNAAATVSRVQAAHRVLLGSETSFQVALEYDRPTVREVTLELFENGQPVQTQAVTLHPAQREQQVKLAYRPTTPGLHRYEFGIAAEPAANDNQPPERYGLNVQVVDERVELLVIEDRWRWEFKYLRRVLEDDPSFNFTGMISRGEQAYVQFGEPERRANLGGFPRSREELDWFDVVVLGDVHPARWPKGFAQAVSEAVIEGGKSIVLVAGPHLHEVAQVPELHLLLPVELSHESALPLEGPLAIQVTPEGAQSPFFAGLSGELPAIDRVYPPLRKRPGATILVEVAEQANSAGRLICMAEQSVGRGRVVYIGTDALWKWHTQGPVDDQGVSLHGKFWQQTLRALTPSQRVTPGGLGLRTDRSRYEVGSRVSVCAERTALVDDEATLQATVTLPDGRRLPLELVPDGLTTGGFTARFDASLPGRYRISLAALVDGQPVAEASTAIEATVASAELADQGIDRAALSRIAQRSGGKAIDLADQTTWPTAAKAAARMIDERQTVHLSSNVFLLALLCLVLGADWLVRLFRGYV